MDKIDDFYPIELKITLKIMDKKEILKILEDWNFWGKEINTGIRRNFYLDKLKKFLLSEEY